MSKWTLTCIEAGEVGLGEAVHDVGDRLGAGPHRDFNRFLGVVNGALPRGIRMTAKRKRLLRTALAERDEEAEPVVKRMYRRGVVAVPIQGLFEVGEVGGGRMVEYEPDTALRDTEQIPLPPGVGRDPGEADRAAHAGARAAGGHRGRGDRLVRGPVGAVDPACTRGR